MESECDERNAAYFTPKLYKLRSHIKSYKLFFVFINIQCAKLKVATGNGDELVDILAPIVKVLVPELIRV